MGFIPVNFSTADTSTLKADLCNPFKFSPFSRAVLFTKPHNIFDPPTAGYRFNILNLAYYLKVHNKSCTLYIYLLCFKCGQLSIMRFFIQTLTYRISNIKHLYCYRNDINCQDAKFESRSTNYIFESRGCCKWLSLYRTCLD